MKFIKCLKCRYNSDDKELVREKQDDMNVTNEWLLICPKCGERAIMILEDVV